MTSKSKAGCRVRLEGDGPMSQIDRYYREGIDGFASTAYSYREILATVVTSDDNLIICLML